MPVLMPVAQVQMVLAVKVGLWPGIPAARQPIGLPWQGPQK